MSRKRYTPEQIIGMLRQAEVDLAQGDGCDLPSSGCFRTELLPLAP
jgi:hypothetical protein